MGFVLFRTIALCSLPANRDYAVVLISEHASRGYEG